MEFLLVVLAAIVVLILGWQFIKHYDKIDIKFFGGRTTPDYKPFGRIQVIVCACLGAFLSGIPLAHGTLHISMNESSLMFAVALALLVVISYDLYEAIARMPTFGSRIGKLFFLLFSCAIGTGIGALASVLVLLTVALLLICFVAWIMLQIMSGRNVGSVIDEFGSKRTLKEGMDGNLVDDLGRSWQRNDNGTVSRND